MFAQGVSGACSPGALPMTQLDHQFPCVLSSHHIEDRDTVGDVTHEDKTKQAQENKAK